MDFGLNETEEMIRSSAREFLEREAGPKLVRGGVDSTIEFWHQVSEMGWPGLAISDVHGGAGMGLDSLGVLAEQWGAYLAKGPLFESAVLVAPAIERHASVRLKKEVLPRLADGSSTATVALMEGGLSWRSEDIDSVAVKTENGWAITGTKRFVNYGKDASYLLIAARTGSKPAEISLFLIDRQSTGISEESLEHATGTPTSVLSLNEVLADSSRLIGGVHEGSSIFDELVTRAAAFRSIQLAGLGRRVLEITTAYVKERKQFGVPIGSFQAVQHHLADMAVSVQRSEHLARRAVWAVSEKSEDANVHVSRAKQVTSALIPQVCWTAHQCHGAIGFTMEHDLHFYTRHALSWATEFGDAAKQSDQLASALGL